MTSSINNIAISPAKADRLFWLGRYAERVVLSLHILRKFYDPIIDDPTTQAHADFCQKMGIPCNYSDARDFMQKYLYDATSDVSVINMLERVKDNAILLREEIKSETLSYVEMAINFMKSAGSKGLKLYELQYVTDMMYSFWGAIEDKVQNERSRDIMNKGKYLEKMDIYQRFSYPPSRIQQVQDRIDKIDFAA